MLQVNQLQAQLIRAEKYRLNEPVITKTDTTFYSDSGSPTMILPQKHGDLTISGNNQLAQAGQESVPANRKEFIDRVRKRGNEFQNMSDQMIAEVYQWEKTMTLDNNEVNFALTRSFHFSGIETPFEFAVIKDGKVQEGTFKKSGKNDFLKSNYMVQLFPDNILKQNLILSVIFPERANYVLGSNGMASWRIIALFIHYPCYICVEPFLYYKAEKDFGNEVRFPEQYDT